MRLTVSSPYDAASVPIGASIMHDGCCLTVVETASQQNGMSFVVEVAPESLALTTLGQLEKGDRVNLERWLRVGDELGGHIVQGHVDGLGEVLSVKKDGEGWRIRIKPPPSINHLIAPKGSIAIQGVSLTVNEVEGRTFGVNLIPHTWEVTTLGALRPGATVNLEIDMLARYLARWNETA